MELSRVRELAAEFGYTEEHYCTRYTPVVHFSKGLNGETALVQVYLNTAFVSVCISGPIEEDSSEQQCPHRRSWKLHFEANVSIKKLNEILKKPDHSIKIYTRQSHNMNWQCGDSEVCDTALRWRHVALATGLSTDPEELDKIMGFCSLFDTCMFEPGVHSCLAHGHFGCGSLCALSNVLLQVGADHEGVIGFCSIQGAMERYRGLSESVDYQLGFHACLNSDVYMEEFGNQVKELEKELASFRSPVRRELVMWFFERIRCPWRITLLGAGEKPLIGPLSFACHFAHVGYTKLVSSEHEQAQLCLIHGIFEHRLDEDSDADDATEATAAESDESLSAKEEGSEGGGGGFFDDSSFELVD